MRIAALTLCVLLSAGSATAQKLELGGTIAAGCKGSDGSICGGGTSPLVGAHASVWAANRFELTARVARVGWDDYSLRLSGQRELVVTNRSRSFVSFLFVYHFMQGRPVRPMFGLGSGWYSDARHVACRPTSCEAPPPSVGPAGGVVVSGPPDLGAFRDRDTDIIFVLGLSGDVRERWVWRGGWQSHRFGNDENMTQAFFVGAGYRFGGR
jgi:hypothetical protein